MRYHSDNVNGICLKAVLFYLELRQVEDCNKTVLEYDRCVYVYNVVSRHAAACMEKPEHAVATGSSTLVLHTWHNVKHTCTTLTLALRCSQVRPPLLPSEASAPVRSLRPWLPCNAFVLSCANISPPKPSEHKCHLQGFPSSRSLEPVLGCVALETTALRGLYGWRGSPDTQR